MGAASPWWMVLACLQAFSRLVKAIPSQCLRSTHTKTGLSVLYAFLYNSGKPKKARITPQRRPGPILFIVFSLSRRLPRPLPRPFPKTIFSIDLPVIFCQRSTFCTNRAHKLCVSSQGFFSFCIQSRFFGIPELYKLFACFIIYFSFFARFNCLLYLQNFPSVS